MGDRITRIKSKKMALIKERRRVFWVQSSGTWVYPKCNKIPINTLTIVKIRLKEKKPLNLSKFFINLTNNQVGF